MKKNGDNVNMATGSSRRCCPCMKKGRCKRCLCTKNGKNCVDCWPSLSNPTRCLNLPVSNNTETSMVPNVTVSDANLLDSTPRVFSDPNEDDELDNAPTPIAMATQNSPPNSEVSGNHSFSNHSLSANSDSPPCPPPSPLVPPVFVRSH